MPSIQKITRNDRATEVLFRWFQQALESEPTSFAVSHVVARRLGAQMVDGVCQIALWTPDLVERGVPTCDVVVEILVPDPSLCLVKEQSGVSFRRHLIPTERVDDFTLVAVDGIRPGTRSTVGNFYSLRWRDEQGVWQRRLDPLADSLPFGAMAPAEVYDVDAMQAERADRRYYERLDEGGGVHKIGPPTAILQIHVPTATAEGTLASLTREIRRVSELLRCGSPLGVGDELFMGYDAVELMPVEPTTVYESGPDFWSPVNETADEVVVHLRRPDTLNWGYDVVVAGSAAVNPVLLETGRPDELLDLSVALHTFHGGPRRLILDLVFGHADDQGKRVLPPHFFAGSNLYGQRLNYRQPRVRAILLEMQRRKVDFGVDGVRVDAAQDFTWDDPSTGQPDYDDDYLQLMADEQQQVAGTTYRPWFVFEDGRPWPRDDWELTSDYRGVIATQRDDDVFQWGPLTFSHNTPFLYGFWLAKLWRIREMIHVGSRWVSGTANHDTLRRGSQVDPNSHVNTRLGATMPEILRMAYDNPAVSMLTYVALPGVPMDFLNAIARAPWGFWRNQDDRYGVKIVAEESSSMVWLLDDASYADSSAFERLKALGFGRREDLTRFMTVLSAMVDVTDYDLGEMARLMNLLEPPLAGPAPLSPDRLKRIARAWMEDMHDYGRVSRALASLDPRHVSFVRRLREYRHEHAWLRDDYGPHDHFDYLRPVSGHTIFVSLRHGPDVRQVLCLVHLEGGESAPFDPLDLPIPGLSTDGWQVALCTPAVDRHYTGGPLILRDGCGVVMHRPRGV